jgi:hypothetical protein
MSWKTPVAVIAGYAVMIAVTLLLFLILSKVSPERFGPSPNKLPGTTVIVVILAVGLATAVAGGWTTARIAPSAPRGHVLALVGVVCVMSLISLLQPAQEAAPGWYRAGLFVVGVVGTLLGGEI